MGGFKNFIFCTRHSMFDVRHYMLAGCVVMTMVLLLVSQTSLQARVIDPEARFAALSSGAPVSGKAQAAGKTEKDQGAVEIPSGFSLRKFTAVPVLPQDLKLTRLASLKAEETALKFSPKARKSCSLEAARAAANGDTSKISPCMTALLSGDMEDLVTLPEKMSAFFINTMNSDISDEKKANVFINSMMEMMNTFAGDKSEKTPEKTAATGQ